MAKQPLPPTYLFASLIMMALLNDRLPGAELIAYPYNLTGIMPLFMGIILNLFADRAFKRAGTSVKPFEKTSSLITDGVFRYSRNPMYLGMVLILLGTAVLMGSLTPFVVVAAFAIAMGLIFIRVEERALAERFGEGWQAYRKRVRRWL